MEEKYAYLCGKVLSFEDISSIPKYGYYAQSCDQTIADACYTEGLHTSPLNMIGLFIQNNGRFQNNLLVPIVDVFGYTEHGESVTLRIRGWDPEYLCKVPIAYDPNIFMKEIDKALANDLSDGIFKLSIKHFIDDRHFNFERKEPFICISSNSPAMLKRSFNVVLEVYSAARERSISSSELAYERSKLENFPLRYSDDIGPNSYSYHLMIRSGIPLIGLIQINKYEPIENMETKTKRMLLVHIEDIQKADDNIDLLHYGISASYDIETDNLNPTRRKISDHLYDPIITIGVSFYKMLDRKPLLNVGFYYDKKPSNPLNNALLIRCSNEEEMIKCWAYIMECLSSDVILSFNGESFDNEYVWSRAEVTGAQEFLACKLSRYNLDVDTMDWKARFKVGFTFKGTYKGDGIIKTNLNRFVTTQRASFDARLYFQAKYPKEFGETGSLNAMLKYFNVSDPDDTSGDVMHKMDLPISTMYAYWRAADNIINEDTKNKIKDIIDYCIKDCRCTHMLILEQGVYHDLFEKAVASYTTLNDSMHKADGLRVNKTCAKYAYHLNIAYMDQTPPVEYQTEIEERIGGGEVKSLLPGHQRCISSLDYKSQYPAQMRGSNIDTSAKIPAVMLDIPDLFGINIIERSTIIDAYGERERYVIEINNVSDDTMPIDRITSNDGILCNDRVSIDSVLCNDSISGNGVSSDNSISSDSIPSDDSISSNDSVSSNGVPSDNSISSNGVSSDDSISSDRISSDDSISSGSIPLSNKQYVVEQFWTEGTRGLRKTYYVQSMRDKRGKPIEHYAIKEVMETDLSDQRDKIKGQMKSYTMLLKIIKGYTKGDMPYDKLRDALLKMADKERTSTFKQTLLDATSGDTDMINNTLPRISSHSTNQVIRFNGKQGAVKVIMNSTYGVEGSILFALCDYTTAGTITWCSRQLIGFLRKCLATRRIIVPYSMHDFVEKYIKLINEYIGEDAISMHTLESLPDNGIPELDKYGKPVGILIDKATCLRNWPDNKWVEIDFNEYTAEVVYQDTDSNYFRNTGLTDTILDKYSSNLREGMYNAMKAINTYNVLMNEVVTTLVNRWPIKLSFEGAFFIAYYWPQKKRYIGIKCPEKLESINDVLLGVDFSGYEAGIDISNFLAKRSIKVTGADIIRRDTSAYVIKGLFKFLQELLNPIPPPSLRTIAERILEEFLNDLKHWDPLIVSKQQKYNPSKVNDVSIIVDRLRKEADELDAEARKMSDEEMKRQIQEQAYAKKKLIPENFQAVRYVVTKNKNQYKDAHGIATISVRDRMKLLDEGVTGEDLDASYYFERLANALATFLFDEMQPALYKIAMMTKDKKDKTTLINDMKNAISAELKSKYFVAKGHTKMAKETYKNIRDNVIDTMFIAPTQAKTVERLFNEMSKIDTKLEIYFKKMIAAEKKRLRSRYTIDMKKYIEQLPRKKSELETIRKEIANSLKPIELRYMASYLNIMQYIRDVDTQICDIATKQRRQSNGDMLSPEMIASIRGSELIDEDKVTEVERNKALFEWTYRRYVCVMNKLGDEYF